MRNNANEWIDRINRINRIYRIKSTKAKMLSIFEK